MPDEVIMALAMLIGFAVLMFALARIARKQGKK